MKTATPPRWFWVDSPGGYSYGMVAVDDTIVAAALEGDWAIGKHVDDVIHLVSADTLGSTVRSAA